MVMILTNVPDIFGNWYLPITAAGQSCLQLHWLAVWQCQNHLFSYHNDDIYGHLSESLSSFEHLSYPPLHPSLHASLLCRYADMQTMAYKRCRQQTWNLDILCCQKSLWAQPRIRQHAGLQRDKLSPAASFPSSTSFVVFGCGLPLNSSNLSAMFLTV